MTGLIWTVYGWVPLVVWESYIAGRDGVVVEASAVEEPELSDIVVGAWEPSI